MRSKSKLQRLRQTLQPRCLLRREDRQHRHRAGDIGDDEKHPDDRDRAHQPLHAAGDVVAQQRDRFSASKAEHHGGPEDGAVGVERRRVVGACEVGGGPIAHAEEGRRHQQHCDQQERGNRAEHRQPLAHAHADQARAGDRNGQRRCDRQPHPSRLQRRAPLRRDERQHFDDVEERARKVRQIADPIDPPAEESRERPHRVAAPSVHRAFTLEASCEFRGGDGQRRQKADSGQNPDWQRSGANGGGGGEPADAERQRRGIEHQLPEIDRPRRGHEPA